MTDSGPDQPASEVVPLDLSSFNYDERMELQAEFDCDFADIWDRIAAKYSLGDNRDRSTDVKMLDRYGNPRFAEEMLRFAVWIQRRRSNPGAQLEEFDAGGWTVLARHLWAPAPLAPGPSRQRPKRT